MKNKFFYFLLFIFVILISILSLKLTESFVLVDEHTYTFDELNPIIIYTHNIDYNDSRDIKYVKTLLSTYNIKWTNNDYYKLKSDLIFLPESVVLKSKLKDGTYPYSLLSNMDDISYLLIQDEDSVHINSFREMEGKTLAVYEYGYSYDLWIDVINLFSFSNPPRLVKYRSTTQLINLFKNGEIDAWANLSTHPDNAIHVVSTEIKIRLIPWEEDDIFSDMMVYKIKGLKRTNINLKFYSSYIYGFGVYLKTFGFAYCLFVKNSYSDEIVYNLTNSTFTYQGVIRPNSLVFSDFIPVHNGTRMWLKDKGFVNIYSGPEEEACKLLAGKNACEGEMKLNAKRFFERDNVINKTELNDIPSPTSYLQKSLLRQYLPVYGKYYDSEVNHKSFVCFEYPSIRQEKDCSKIGGTWDRPCLSNEECPFYKANQNYKNEFGKCMNGSCEMPLNVNKKGFRKYNSLPICHNSGNNDSLTACKMSGAMVTPDYAFKNDRQARIDNLKELTIRGIKL